MAEEQSAFKFLLEEVVKPRLRQLVERPEDECEGDFIEAVRTLHENPELFELVADEVAKLRSDELSGEIAIAIYWRLKRLIEAVFSDGMLCLSEGVDYLYIKLHRAFVQLLDETACLAYLKDTFPQDALPQSLHSLIAGGGWEAAWEFEIEPALATYTGHVLRHCAEMSLEPFVKEADDVLAHWDEAIAAFVAMKRKEVQAFWDRVQKASQAAPSGDPIETSPDPDALTAGRGRPPGSVSIPDFAHQYPVAYFNLLDERARRPTQADVAAVLCISERTLREYLHRHGLPWPPERPPSL